MTIAPQKSSAPELEPIWRGQMNGNGVFTLALDPDEATFVLSRGFGILDGKEYSASMPEGWTVDKDGRVTIRFQIR
jgi:hypothetical protein